MKTIPRTKTPIRFLTLSLWLAPDLSALAAFLLLRHNRAMMNAWTVRFASPLQAALGKLCAFVPFSVMEPLIVALVLCALCYLAWSVRAVVRAHGNRVRRALYQILGGCCAALCMIAVFCWMWGVYYWADSFQNKSGLHAAPIAPETLRAVTEYFADGLTRSADGVARDETGAFAVSVKEILAKAPYIYDTLETRYPFLAFNDTGVKPMAFSRLMSRMDFTGLYCACTGEANVNIDSPACLLASTAAHEMAHQRGFASEQECNFLAVLACLTSGDPVYTYSGWLMGYIYLANALYGADPDAYFAIRDRLPEVVRVDLARNNAYWNQFRDGVIRKAATKAYDGILKGYGESRGMKSYGAMVDLLAAYYGNASAAYNSGN